VATAVAAAQQKATPLHLLVLDDEPHIRLLCSSIAAQSGMNVTAVASAQEALRVINTCCIDILITDLKLRESSGLDLIHQLHDTHPEVAIIVVTGYGTIDSAIMATRLGVMHYIAKPFRTTELRSRLEQVVQSIEIGNENGLSSQRLRTKHAFRQLIGVSPKMKSLYTLTEKVSQHEYPVLILGESGTGKELLARCVHFSGPRRDRPFAPVDCASLVPTLIESELFGYVKGAFTGAIQSRKGLLEAAQGGTLFLDEIGDMPVQLQAKLLRALQEHEVRPVGSTERRRIDVRIISATNRDLQSAIRGGTFRQDLYFRLNVVQMKLPALRDRKIDIPLLVDSFLEKFGRLHGPARTISERALRQLMDYDWPGNVRELENVIERAVALGSGLVVETSDLPTTLHSFRSEQMPGEDKTVHLAEVERRAIFRALCETKGDKLDAARQLGIAKTTLYRKLRAYDAQSAAGPVNNQITTDWLGKN
jgi:DNA-binding NtrC family response regulator